MTGPVVLVILVIMKTVMDLRFHLRERQKSEGRSAGGGGDDDDAGFRGER